MTFSGPVPGENCQGDTTPAICPQVSILIVARNTGALIGDAINSARAQTFRDVEVVVVDDASSDDTKAIAEQHAVEDARVRVLDGPRAGLAAIRNVSLSAARGRWAAILDSDDMLHHRHIEQLVDAAIRSGAEIVAANMVAFAQEQGRTRSALFAGQQKWQQERWITLLEFVRANSASGDPVSVGYFKPLFNMDFLRQHELRYDLRLRIAEDYDLVARCMAAGARYLYVPTPTYFYRRHAGSTSHRQSVADLSAMLSASNSAAIGSCDPALLAALAVREAGIRSALRHAKAIDALKARNPFGALAAIGYDGQAWHLMMQSIREGGCRRFLRSPAPGAASRPATLVLGVPAAESAQAQEIARLAAHGVAIEFRAPAANGAAKAKLADGLPPLSHIFVAPPATLDDAAYAMAPGIVPDIATLPAADTAGSRA